MCHIPNIDFHQQLPALGEEAIRTINAMSTILHNRQIEIFGINPQPPFTNVNQTSQFEDQIIQNLRHCRENNYDEDQLRNVFNLIQLWGGITCRNIYIKNGGIGENLNIANYRTLAEVCSAPFDLGNIYKWVCEFNRLTPHIGIASITKHTRFWMGDTNFKLGALPIYDSIMARHVMNKRIPDLRDLWCYWTCMIATALIKEVSLSVLERHLYNNYRNRNTP